MLTCRELIEFLDDYVDGRLDAARRRDFDAHLALCPDCVEYLRSYRLTGDLCRESLGDRADEIPPDVPDDLVRAIVSARVRR